jgi:transposase
LFDNWYASADNIALFERLGLSWVTRVKENAKVYLGEQRISVKEVGASVKKANYHYYSRLGARARSFEVKVGDRLVKLVALKDDSHAEGGRTKYLMTNAVSLTTREVVNWYRRRWVIEVFFRDAKQYLGLARSEARREEAVISHVALVCVAYTFLQLVKPVGEQQRASIKASRDAMAVLVVVAAVNVEIARPKPDGEMERISYEHLWHPVRTRLPGAVCPELLDFS